jgi:3-oxoacyl-[acyl-carrier-protein] synthase-1
VSRTLHKPKRALDLWHPAECTGEIGAVAGTTAIALAGAACRKNFSRGSNILVHLANDDGERAALTLEYRVAA